MRTATLVFVVALAAAGACRTGPPPGGAAIPPPGSVTQPVYIDVRTAEEFASGHVVGALHIPHDQMEARWEELAAYKDKDLVLYCRSGRRSGLALTVLKEKGFTKVENGGGLADVRARGVPVTK